MEQTEQTQEFNPLAAVDDSVPTAFDRFPQTDEELWEFVATVWGVEIPRLSICPNHCSPFEAFADAYFCRAENAIWLACIPAGEKVWGREGPVSIEKVEIGSEVLGWKKGSPAWGRVTALQATGLDYPLRLQTRSGDLRVTGKHRVLVARKHHSPSAGQGNYHRVVWTRKWILANKIVAGDFLVQPFDTAKQFKKPLSDKNIRANLLWEWLGLICGDGWVIKDHKVGVAHHIDAPYMDHYRRTVKLLYEKTLSYIEANRSSYVYSVEAVRDAECFIGSTAHTKRVPKALWAENRENILAFLRGYCDADGTIRKDGEVVLYSCNPDLLAEIRQLGLMVGLNIGRVQFHAMAGSCVINGRTVERNDMHSISVYGGADILGTNDSSYKWRCGTPKITAEKTGGKKNHWRHPPSGKGFRHLCVLSVEREEREVVYDLTVEGTDSFVCENFFVHNSRGLGGKSFLLATLGLTEAVCLGATATVLGGSGAQSQNVHRYMQDMWSYPAAPRQLLAEDPTKMRTVLRNGASIQALLASSTSVRGPHPCRLRMDECVGHGSLVSCVVGNSVVQLPIEKVAVGERVLSLVNGELRPAEVLSSKFMGVRPTLRITTEDGNELICTSNHKFATEKGWQEASALACGAFLNVRSSDVQSQGDESSALFGRMWNRALLQEGNSCHRLLQSLSGRTLQTPKKFLQYLWRRAYKQLSWRSLQALLQQASCRTKKSLRDVRWKSYVTSNSFLSCLLEQASFRGWEERSLAYSSQSSGEDRCSTKLYSKIQQGSNLFRRSYSKSFEGSVWSLFRFTGFCRTICCGPLLQKEKVGDRSLGSESATEHTLQRENLRSNEKGTESFGCSKHNRSHFALSLSKVSKIEAGPTVPVYDLTVSESHSYVVEGFLVHNCDEMSLPILDAALGQPMSKDGIPAQTVCSSTHHYPDGTVTELLRRAKENGMPTYSWCYRESMAGGWLSPRDVTAARTRVPIAMWDVEFELQEPSPEGRAIQPQAVEWTFDAALGYWEGAEGQQCVLEPPMTGAKYVTSADWAKQADWTVIITLRIDVTPCRLVCFERLGRRPWPMMVERFNARVERYPGLAIHDATGLGSVVDDFLAVKAVGEILAGRNRSELFSEYIAALENREVVAPRIDFMYAEHKYCGIEDLWGKGHPPDSFVAGALAWRGKNLNKSQANVRSIVTHPKWQERMEKAVQRQLEPWTVD